MKNECIFFLAFCLTSSILAAQAGAGSSLEAKVENEFRSVYFDKEPPYVPLDKRLLALGDRKAISRVLAEIIRKYKRARPRIDDEYRYLVDSVQMAGKFEAAEAVPALIEIEKEAGERSELKIFTTMAIGEIDPKGNQSLLLEALHNSYYPVRHAAAEGLSRTGDQSVLYELEVAASREDSRETSREIQALADTLRAHINSRQK
jgi:HEAT repeat protein